MLPIGDNPRANLWITWPTEGPKRARLACVRRMFPVLAGRPACQLLHEARTSPATLAGRFPMWRAHELARKLEEIGLKSWTDPDAG
jgi:hypothetical protein